MLRFNNGITSAGSCAAASPDRPRAVLTRKRVGGLVEAVSVGRPSVPRERGQCNRGFGRRIQRRSRVAAGDDWALAHAAASSTTVRSGGILAYDHRSHGSDLRPTLGKIVVATSWLEYDATLQREVDFVDRLVHGWPPFRRFDLLVFTILLRRRDPFRAPDT